VCGASDRERGADGETRRRQKEILRSVVKLKEDPHSTEETHGAG